MFMQVIKKAKNLPTVIPIKNRGAVTVSRHAPLDLFPSIIITKL